MSLGFPLYSQNRKPSPAGWDVPIILQNRAPNSDGLLPKPHPLQWRATCSGSMLQSFWGEEGGRAWFPQEGEEACEDLSRHRSASLSSEEAVVSPYRPLHLPHTCYACPPLSCFWLPLSSHCQGLCRALVALERSDFPLTGVLFLPGWLWRSSGSWLWKSWPLGTSLDEVRGTRRWLALNPECLDNPHLHCAGCHGLDHQPMGAGGISFGDPSGHIHP